jgi:predicted nucleotidyltransferase
MHSPKPLGLRDRLAALCNTYDIQILYAFGSRAKEALAVLTGAREAFSPSGSDLDVGAKPAGLLGIKEKAGLANDLEDLLGVPRVDLVVLPEADPFVAANVIRGERLYCADEYLADEYELYILRRAGDLAPLERERLSLLEKR